MSRPSAHKRGYDSKRWAALSRAIIADAKSTGRLCEYCTEPIMHGQWIDVDHNPPLTGPDDPGLLDQRRCRPQRQTGRHAAAFELGARRPVQ